jgi:hypothetical protein
MASNPAMCIDDDLLARVFGLQLDLRKDPGQRDACGCVVSRDIVHVRFLSLRLPVLLRHQQLCPRRRQLTPPTTPRRRRCARMTSDE